MELACEARRPCLQPCHRPSSPFRSRSASPLSSPCPTPNAAATARSGARSPRCHRIRRPSLLVVELSPNPPYRSSSLSPAQQASAGSA
uniref:Uncharacterized protein n=1 Tax=Oryza punctata TaxID=4537 RepID=A0A0E0KVC2_ORYPU